jgi:hypothetical protein
MKIAKAKLLLFLVLVTSLHVLSGEDTPRAMGYGISDPITINTIITIIGPYFGISNPITINTMLNDYSAFRLSPIPTLPNFNPILLAQGGYGFAWYRVEGELNGIWQSVTQGSVRYQTDSGIVRTAQIGRFTYPHSNQEYRSDPGMVMIYLGSDEIGSIGSTGTATVFEINGSALSNPPVTNFQVANIDRSVEWYYQYKIRAGVGLTAGVATIGANAEVGQGASVRLDVSESSLDDWDALTISRSLDIGAGVEAKLGPPRLGVLSVGAGVSAGIATSYIDEYSFTRSELEGGKALYCGYLFLEPLLGLRQTSSRTVRFTNSLGEAILTYGSLYNLDLASNRLADEAKTTVKAGLNASTAVTFGRGEDLLPDLRNQAFLSLGANVGAEGYAGWSYKYALSGERTRSLFMGGRVAASAGFGIKEVFPKQDNFEFDRDWNLFKVNSSREFGYELQAKSGIGSNSYRFINSSGMDLTYNPIAFGYSPNNVSSSTWLDISSPQMISIMNSKTSLGQSASTIGVSPVSLSLNNTSYSNAIASILDEVSLRQNQGVNLMAQYGADISAVRDFTIDLDVPFPIIPTPVYISMGGGISFGRKDAAPLNRGYWYKGLPYLSHQGQDYGDVDIQFADVLGYVWDNVKSGTNWGVFAPILGFTFVKNTLFPWLRFEEDYTVELNDAGSYLTLKSTSLPDTLTEAYSEYWTWQDEPENENLSPSARQELTQFNRQLRAYREDLAGMKYGIGGFYGLTPEGAVFADSAKISISYTDDEIAGLDESSLAVYWEDNEGDWHFLPSIVDADSNRVDALITEFRTYTLAPRMPQGSLNLMIQPDSLAADGISTATVQATNLVNNDGSAIVDGALFTIVASRGSIVSSDAAPSLPGLQIAVNGGILEFEVQADLLARPISLSVNSVSGYAHGQVEIPLYGIAAPQTPILLSAEPEHRALRLSWQTVDDPNIAGYRIYYNVNSSGEPYTGTSNASGSDSPVDVGVTDSFILTGLNNDDVYHLAVKAIAVSGLESEYSNELSSQPNLQVIKELEILKQDQSVTLTWQPSFGASSYKIYRGFAPNLNMDEMTLIGQTSALTYTDNTISDLDRSFYIVVAVGH